MSSNSRNHDTAKAYADGVRDGRENDYNPPHDKGLLGEFFSSGYSKDEREDRDAYREGWSRGSKGR